MILTHPSEVSLLLKRLGIRPSRTWGQHFLIDANILRIMLTTASIHPKDTVVEVGPGLGVLTEWLVRQSALVIAVEKDPRLCEFLRDKFANVRNLQLIEGDILEQQIEPLIPTRSYRVVSNLPYVIASRYLFDLAESNKPPESVTVSLQKEVADRILAKPSSPDYGLLSVIVQLRFEAKLIHEIPPTCFLPPPKVKSTLIHMVLRPSPQFPRNREVFRALLKTCFEHRRKQMLGLLRHTYGLGENQTLKLLATAGIPSQARPESVSPTQWVMLSDGLSEITPT